MGGGERGVKCRGSLGESLGGGQGREIDIRIKEKLCQREIGREGEGLKTRCTSGKNKKRRRKE